MAGFWEWLASLPTGGASFVGTLAGSSLGLIAILIGALANAQLNRNRDDALRDSDRIALASALYAELQGIHRTFVGNAAHLTRNSPDRRGGFVLVEPSIKILPAMLFNIGLLRSETIRKIMDAYVLAETYLDVLILLSGELRTHLKRREVYMPGELAGPVGNMNEDKARVIKEAMEALTPYLR